MKGRHGEGRARRRNRVTRAQSERGRANALGPIIQKSLSYAPSSDRNMTWAIFLRLRIVVVVVQTSVCACVWASLSSFPATRYLFFIFFLSVLSFLNCTCFIIFCHVLYLYLFLLMRLCLFADARPKAFASPRPPTTEHSRRCCVSVSSVSDLGLCKRRCEWRWWW